MKTHTFIIPKLTKSQAEREKQKANRMLGLAARRARNRAIDALEKTAADIRRSALGAAGATVTIVSRPEAA